MNREVNSITARLSLREPQRRSLEILADVLEQIELGKTADVTRALDIIKDAYPTVSDFERDFPSLCFALATGVGKTRLMGAFISYLYLTGRSRHFFVLAPNKTIYEKLIGDFTPGNPKYVFKGIQDFAITRPVIITGDNYEQGQGVRFDTAQAGSTIQGRLFESGEAAYINIFNVDKINKADSKPGAERTNVPRIKRLQEYIGESYFDYLAGLPDLVLLMDEAHRYRGSAGARAISELKPILGLELTATPKTVGARPEPFKNVIYSYSLGEAMNDGFVKEPAVATRENFRPADHTPEDLERIKLEDAIYNHEFVKGELTIYTRQNELPPVHPFVLVVAQDTAHATALKALIESDVFFEGRYKGHVIEVHSNLRGDESDEAMARLVAVEHDPETEIVIHVNKLKEGWDVTNLYTIVPLRASASEILTEQTIGRGLRLPFGKRTGVEALDCLTIVAHDRFQEIIDRAKDDDSIIKKQRIIGENGDVPPARTQVLEVPTVAESQLTGQAPTMATATPQGGQAPAAQPAPVLQSEPERQAAAATMQVLKRFEKLSGLEELKKPEVQAKIKEEVEALIAPQQQTLEGIGAPTVDVAKVVEAVTTSVADNWIEIPEIVILPTEQSSFWFNDFDLQVPANYRPQPVDNKLLVHNLVTEQRSTRQHNGPAIREARLEDYLVSQLMDHDEIDYDDNAALLYKLSGQMVAHVRSYLAKAEDVENVIISQQRQMAEMIFTQLQEHVESNPTDYEAKVKNGFTLLKPNALNIQEGDTPRNFKNPVTNRSEIRRLVFTGFGRCCYPYQKFDSDSERQFAVIIDGDSSVIRWMKPGPGQFRIEWKNGQPYWPDFVVETQTEKLICEVKARDEMDDEEVKLKAQAGSRWCEYATQIAQTAGKKPWRYLLIPHDDLDSNRTLQGLISSYLCIS